MKHEYTSEVKFRRKHAIKGDYAKVVKDPGTKLLCQEEMDAITAAVGKNFFVHDGDETGALIQVEGWHDLSWIPSDCLQRTA